MDYARRLVYAGVAAEILIVRGAFHGFDRLVPDGGTPSLRFLQEPGPELVEGAGTMLPIT